jgi:hypothetical protein
MNKYSIHNQIKGSKTMKTTNILTATLLLSAALGTSAIAEEPKSSYQTTPPKNHAVSHVPVLNAKVTSNIKPFTDLKQDATLNAGVQLWPGSNKLVEEPQAQDNPQDCIKMLPITENGYNPNVVRIQQKEMSVRLGEEIRAVRMMQIESYEDINTHQIARWYLTISDTNSCLIYLEQSDQTAALRLLETLQNASFDPQQAIEIELQSCSNEVRHNLCFARLRGMLWFPHQ